MNPLYHFLARLTKRLEQQADLDVVNKLLIIYFINIAGIIFNLGYGILALLSKNYHLAWFLLSTTLLLMLILLFLYFTKRQKVTKILLTAVSGLIISYLVYTGGTAGSGYLWLLIFPTFTIPLFGLSRGNLISFLYFLIAIVYFIFQNKLQTPHFYTSEQVIWLMGAYSVIHLMVYLNEFLKLHNYTVMEKTIIESKNEARQKDDFLSKLSHQIRTPLNNLTVVSNLINKSKLDAEDRDLFDTILASTINLINVVNNIVKVSADTFFID